MILIYLAAGKGSRLPKRFREKPKCFVKIKNKTLIERNKIFFKKFDKKIIITGYKNKNIIKISKQFGFEIIFNKKFAKTNMVYSMFLAKNRIDQDVVVCYGDIIFNPNIIQLIKDKKDILPVNKNWLKYWKKRMGSKGLLDDAENLVIEKKYVTHIGGRINKVLPRYQFMGIIKFKKETFLKLSVLFRKLDNTIDMTYFINESIKNNKLKLLSKEYKSFWHEIDTNKDILVAQNSKDIY